MPTQLYNVTGKVTVEISTLVRAHNEAEALTIASQRPIDHREPGDIPFMKGTEPSLLASWRVFAGKTETKDIKEIVALDCRVG